MRCTKVCEICRLTAETRRRGGQNLFAEVIIGCARSGVTRPTLVFRTTVQDQPTQPQPSREPAVVGRVSPLRAVLEKPDADGWQYAARTEWRALPTGSDAGARPSNTTATELKSCGGRARQSSARRFGKTGHGRFATRGAHGVTRPTLVFRTAAQDQSSQPQPSRNPAVVGRVSPLRAVLEKSDADAWQHAARTE